MLTPYSTRQRRTVLGIICTISVTVILSLILIGSSLAFNIIASLFAVALLGSYLTSVSTLAYQRFHRAQLPRSRFSLGRLGLPINIATIAFDLFAFIMVRPSIGALPSANIVRYSFLPAPTPQQRP
jgi:choline transport protein